MAVGKPVTKINNANLRNFCKFGENIDGGVEMWGRVSGKFSV